MVKETEWSTPQRQHVMNSTKGVYFCGSLWGKSKSSLLLQNKSTEFLMFLNMLSLEHMQPEHPIR